MRPVEWGTFQPLPLVSLRSHLPSPCAATLPLGLEVSSRQDRWPTFALRGPLDRFELHGYVPQHVTDAAMLEALVKDICRVTRDTVVIMEDIGQFERLGAKARASIARLAPTRA
jgi:hypothetical protein